MIRDILNTQTSIFDPLAEAMKYGVPLFGLISSQDPTLLLTIAVKIKQKILEQIT